VNLGAYGPVAERVSPVDGGYTAACYRVTCGVTEYRVKVWPSASSDRAQTLGLLDVLAGAGLPVIPPLRTRDGGAVSTMAGAEGLAVLRMSAVSCRRAGRAGSTSCRGGSGQGWPGFTAST
jgi:Ser/Thr protein kinase RdoA (MazF antagonist)